MERKKMNIVMITDDAFALCTGVAICSMIKSKSNDSFYDIHVVCNEVKSENKARLERLNCSGVSVQLDDAPGLEKYENETMRAAKHVSPTAMIKFVLPRYYYNWDKALYVDGDILVLKDLSELYDQNIDNEYLAAVADRTAYFGFGKTYQERLNVEHEGYFNSGVMLLNLQKMRQDNITNRLIEYRKQQKIGYMDQDAFNAVCGEKIKYLSLLFNTISTCVKYADLAHLRQWYPQEELTDENWMKHSVIYHYASPLKPWKYKDVDFFDDWYRVYNNSSFSDVPLTLGLSKEKYGPENSTGMEKRAVSIIMPVYNAQRFLDAALKSILKSKVTLDYELICVDDGSTDNSHIILMHYKDDSRLKIISVKNGGPGSARNIGMENASGKYIAFLDADDLMHMGVLETAVRRAEETNAEIVLCGSRTINDKGIAIKESAGTLYMHIALKDRDVFSSKELGADIFSVCSGMVWGRIFRKDFLESKGLRFPNMKRSEDFGFTYLSLYYSKRITVCNQVLVSYRNFPSHRSLEHTKSNEPLVFWEGCIALYQKMKEIQAPDEVLLGCKLNILQRIRYNLKTIDSFAGFETIMQKLPEMVNFLDFSHEEEKQFSSSDVFLMQLVGMDVNNALFEIMCKVKEENYFEIERINSRYLTMRNSLSYRVGKMMLAIPKKAYLWIKKK